MIRVITTSYAYCADCNQVWETPAYQEDNEQLETDAHILGKLHHEDTGHKVVTQLTVVEMHGIYNK